MKIKYEFFKVEVETKDKSFKRVNKKLNQLYDQLPVTKCLNCPGKCGVEADCCKTFSPPMLLIEFLNSINHINSNWDDEQKNNLLVKCLKSFMNIEKNKPCVLLEEVLCSIYNARPLGCRLFGMYPDKEWEKRLHSIASQIKTNTESLPFFKQCKNIEVEGDETEVDTEKSDSIFEEMHKLDIQLFKDRQFGKRMVDQTATYMPFETHYLCYRMGANFIQQLTDMKLGLRALQKNKMHVLEFRKKERDIKVFVDELEKVIVSDGLHKWR